MLRRIYTYIRIYYLMNQQAVQFTSLLQLQFLLLALLLRFQHNVVLIVFALRTRKYLLLGVACTSLASAL